MHLRKIGAALLLVAACHGSKLDPSLHPATPPTAPTTLDHIAIINASGKPVRDTSVTFAATAGRTIVMRHDAPDDAIFLILEFPPAADSLHRVDSLHLVIHPAAAAYEFTLATADKLPAGATATFSYAIHFQTPAEVAAKYPSPGRLDLLLSPAEVTPDNKVMFIAPFRPAGDMMRFGLAHAGTYALAVMR